MKSIKMLILAGIMALFLLPEAGAAHSRVYVRIAPPAPRKVTVVAVKRPYRNAIYVAGHWKWNGRRYVWVSARWVKPRKGFVYVPGHWRHNRRGWYWVPGHWKRV